jgi:hypothetical protein
MLRYAVNATPRGDNLLFLARKSVLWRVSTPSGWMEAKPWVGFASRGPHHVHRLTAVSDMPNGVWPLNRAVGRAHIREAVPSDAPAPVAITSYQRPSGPTRTH